MRAAIYLRQSLQHQEGIDRQNARCIALAEAKKYSVVETYEDNEVSASKPRSKSNWAVMLAEAAKGRFDVVIAVDLDRLLRTSKDMIDLIETKVLVLTVDGEIDLTTAEGELRASMLTAMARFEVKRKSERQKRANEYRASMGLPSAGKPRFGYKSGNIDINENEALIVRELYQGIVDGKTIYGMAKMLTARGVIFGSKGKRTRESGLASEGKPWQPNRIRGIISNPAYYGCIIVQGKAVPSERVTPIVDAETWGRANAILKDPTRRTNAGRPRSHILSGVMRCGTCDGPMRFTNEGYYCRTPIAGHPMITESKLMPILHEHLALSILSAPRAALNGDSEDEGPMVAALTANYEEAQRVAGDRADGLLPPAVAKKMLVSLRSRRERIEIELERVRASKSGLSVLSKLAGSVFTFENNRINFTGDLDIPKIKENIIEAFNQLDYDQKREVINGLMTLKLHTGRNNWERLEVYHKVSVGLNAEPDYGNYGVEHEG